jgi:acetyltransferase-like isoleucine patch superfamily enzyme
MSPENTPQYSGMMNLLREQDDMPIIHPEIYQPTVLLKTESIFFHDAVSLSASAPAELQRVSRGKVKLCRFATVMTNAVVLPNVTLGIGAVLAAGSVARCNIPDWEVWAGVPAKKIATRIPTYGTAAL